MWLVARPCLRHRWKLSPCPHSCPLVTFTFREPKGWSQDCNPDVSGSYFRPGTNPWNLGCPLKNSVLMCHVVWSTSFSFLTGKKCSPEQSGSLRGLLHFWCGQWPPGRAVTLEDPLLQAAWVLCLLIPIFSPIFSGLQGDCRHNSEEKEEQN